MKINTSHGEYEKCYHGGGGGEKLVKKVSQFIWMAANRHSDIFNVVYILRSQTCENTSILCIT